MVSNSTRAGRGAIGRIALPTCRNYWRLHETLPKVHSASAVLTTHHSHRLTPKYNRNSKRRHHNQLDDLDGDESVISDFRYRIRESLNPTPFRGLAMLTFWLFFGLILTFIAVMIIFLLYSAKDEYEDDRNSADYDSHNGSLIIKALLDHRIVN